ncbi:MAG: phosphopentomutase, partial [Defluviitaleaceae bacterium]|nr:phosphopentomutase [Defluviitaleaceae bacterium]
IVYTSADSVFQVAAHESVVPLGMLYKICEASREMLDGRSHPLAGRVIARPFTGEAGSFKRTENRRDYAVAPHGETVLDALEAQGMTTFGIGKIEDIFCGRGVKHSVHTTNNRDGIDAAVNALKENFDDALIFANLVDFDMLYGHRKDANGYAGALEYFDARLPEIIGSLRNWDALFITADHGCDPTTPSTDHSREYAPVLVYGGKIKPVPLYTRESFADLGATVYKMLAKKNWTNGKCFDLN